MFKKLLVPIDGSKHSLHALEKAILIARKFEGELTLLHVYSVGYPITRGAFDMGETEAVASVLVSEVNEEVRKAGKGILSDGKRRANAEGIQVDVLLREGHAVEEILRTAEDGGFDLIVIGARGLSRVKRILLGSVSQGVTTHAHCPVLVIKQPLEISG
ncbi:MAG: universal stress protein [Candidatus Bathyarchaeota archaeon]|nr:MAG: universal stress protein [Candidatus Bathyarchaeota archaeon]